MKGGLKGLSPHPTGPAPAPQGCGRPQAPSPGMRGWPPGRGLAGWAEFCGLEKEVPSQSWGWQGPRPQLGGVWGGAPLQSPAPPRVGDKPSPYCSQTPPARCPRVHTCPAFGGRRGEGPQEQQRERGGPAGGPALLEGNGEVREDLKTTRINRFMYQEQARVFTS